MDNNLLVLLIILLFVGVVVLALFLFRGKSKASIEAGPLRMGFEGEGKPAELPPAPPPAPPVETPLDVEISNVKVGRHASIRDSAGGRIRADQVDAKGDFTVSRSKEGSSGDSAPKG